MSGLAASAVTIGITILYSLTMAWMQACYTRPSNVFAAVQDFDPIPDLFPCLPVVFLFLCFVCFLTLLASASKTGGSRRRPRAAFKRVAFELTQAVTPTTTIIGNVITNRSAPIIILIDHRITCSSTPTMVISWNLFIIFSIPQSIGRADAGVFEITAGGIGRGRASITEPGAYHSNPAGLDNHSPVNEGYGTFYPQGFESNHTGAEAVDEDAPTSNAPSSDDNEPKSENRGSGCGPTPAAEPSTTPPSLPTAPPMAEATTADAGNGGSTSMPGSTSTPSLNFWQSYKKYRERVNRYNVTMHPRWDGTWRSSPNESAPPDEAPYTAPPSDEVPKATAAGDEAPKPSMPSDDDYLAEAANIPLPEESSKAEPKPTADPPTPAPQTSDKAGAAPSNPEDGAKAAETKPPPTSAADAPSASGLEGNAKEEPSHPVPQANPQPAPKPSLTVEPPTVGSVNWQEIYGCDPYDQPLPPTPASESGPKEGDEAPQGPQPEMPGALLSPPCTPMDCEPDVPGEPVAFPFPPFSPPLSPPPSSYIDEEGDIVLPDVDDCGNPLSAPWSSSEDEDIEMSSDDDDTEMSDAPSDDVDVDTVMTDYSSDSSYFGPIYGSSKGSWKDNLPSL